MSIWIREANLDAVHRMNTGRAAVGTDINARHLRGVRKGWVTGTARPLRIGRRMHFWGIDSVDDDGNLACTARLSVAIVERG